MTYKRRYLTTGFVSVIVLATVPWMAASARAQIPGLPSVGAPDAAGSQPPAGVERRGLVEVTGVKFDGRELFEIASPVVYNRTAPGDLTPVEVRAHEIEGKLKRLVSPADQSELRQHREYVTRLDPDTAVVRVDKRNQQFVLSASDAHLPKPEDLLTVTEQDARLDGVTSEELAHRWQITLQTELRHALEQRQPQLKRIRIARAMGMVAGAAITTILLVLFSGFLTRRRVALQRDQARAEDATKQESGEEAPTASDVIDDQVRRRGSRSLASLLHKQFSVKRRLQVNAFFGWLVAWSFVFLWVGTTAGVLYEFPQTRGLADTIVATPTLLLAAWFAASALNQLAGLLIGQVVTAGGRGGRRIDEPRAALRVPTVESAVKGLVSAVLYAIAILWVVQRLRIVPVTFVALGALAALAVSFAAQSLLKDLVNGILILLEDQYVVGDDITIGDAAGFVEYLNLRITQLRTADGRLITIPNHLVEQVENRTRDWSRVDLKIAVAYETDVDVALRIVGRVAENMAADPQWHAIILDPHQRLFVDEVSHAGLVIRIMVKTIAYQHIFVGPELRRRLKIAFDREGMRVGIPQQAVVISHAHTEPSNGRIHPQAVVPHLPEA
jgi:small-conductance mechanosensitive channel